MNENRRARSEEFAFSMCWIKKNIWIKVFC
jgi:hypothetical protein